MDLNETYSKVHIREHILGQKKKENALSPVLFNFRICHWEGPRNPGGIEIKWDTSDAGLR
jgi:hypothetical protein